MCVLNRIYKLGKRAFKCDSRDYFIKTRGLKLKGIIKVKTIDNHTWDHHESIQIGNSIKKAKWAQTAGSVD